MNNVDKTVLFMHLENYLTEVYEGDPTAIIEQLDLCLYMLFYVKREEFSERDVQRMAETLRNLRDAFAGKEVVTPHSPFSPAVPS